MSLLHALNRATFVALAAAFIALSVTFALVVAGAGIVDPLVAALGGR
jgi:hypothetical protein